MPILADIRDHKVFGRAFKEGMLTILRLLAEKRFGAIPGWAEERLSGMSAAELDAVSDRVFDATSLEELLQ